MRVDRSDDHTINLSTYEGFKVLLLKVKGVFRMAYDDTETSITSHPFDLHCKLGEVRVLCIGDDYGNETTSTAP